KLCSWLELESLSSESRESAQARPRPVVRRSSRSSTSFNPRARAGRDLAGAFLSWRYAQFQSTRPRGARLGVHRLDVSDGREVSIHAPARGATHGWRRRRGFADKVSIHAPARGATSSPRSSRVV